MTAVKKNHHTRVTTTCPECGLEREVWDDATPRRCRPCYWKSMVKPEEHKARKRRENDRRYYWRDPQQKVEEANLDFVLNKEARLAAQRERYRRDPQKFLARALVARAVQKGELAKEPCPCGEAKAEAHHDNYNEPLQVRWLCSRCHGREHRKD